SICRASTSGRPISLAISGSPRVSLLANFSASLDVAGTLVMRALAPLRRAAPGRQGGRRFRPVGLGAVFEKLPTVCLLFSCLRKYQGNQKFDDQVRIRRPDGPQSHPVPGG